MIPIFVVTPIRLILAMLLTFSGISKMFSLKKFSIIVASYGILPRKHVKQLAYAQPFIETFVGLWLLSGIATQYSSVACLLMTLLMTFFVAWALIQKKKMENCGCYGALVQVPLSWKKLAEDLFWVALAVVLVVGVW
jgi:uncharacterized membrane protein YphA (DoxX/SURF4 family)